MPRPVTAQDCGSDQHPGGEPYSRFPDQTMDQIPTHVPNHNSKSGYHSGSSRDEEVCHVSTRNRHEQVDMQVVDNSMLIPYKLSCHVCNDKEIRSKTVHCSDQDETNTAEYETSSTVQTSIRPGVFQMDQTLNEYPPGLRLKHTPGEPWPVSGKSRWLTSSTCKCDTSQPREVGNLFDDQNRDAHREKCEHRVKCLNNHVEALLIAMSSLTRAKMASFIPEELTVDQIEQLKVSPEDSASAKDLESPDAEGISYDPKALKQLPDERIAQLEKNFQHVLGADYDRRKYSIFFDENLRQSDCLSVTLDGCEDFYEVVIQTITGLAKQELPISTRIMAILTKTNYGSQAAEAGPAGPDVESWTQPPACWSRFMSICHEVYLVVEAELVQTWMQLARWFDELPHPFLSWLNLRIHYNYSQFIGQEVKNRSQDASSMQQLTKPCMQ